MTPFHSAVTNASLRRRTVRAMNRPAWISAAVALAALAGTSQEARAACSFGASGEPSLQQSFDSLFGVANAPDAANDCLADGVGPNHDGVWQSTGTSSATILLELAGFADFNEFGVYDPSNPANQLDVFAGRLGPGATASLTFTNVAGGTQITMSIIGSPAPARSTVFLSEAFGFFLSTPQGNTFYSQSSLNTGGVDRSYAYRGTGQWFQRGGALGTQFGVSDAILAYEDLLQGDNDFQDFVVLVRGVEPIPLPAAALLFLSGLIGLRARGERRRIP
jgi:hypothetical protein